MILRNRSKISAKSWDDLVNNAPEGFLFAHSSWLNMIEKVKDWQLIDKSFGITIDKKLAAVVPLHYSPLQKTLTSSGWGPANIIIHPDFKNNTQDIFEKAVHHINDISNKHTCTSINFGRMAVINSKIKKNNDNYYANLGFSANYRSSKVIDLSKSEATLLKDLSQDARYNIRRAQKNGFTAKLTPWLPQLESYYKLHKETYRKSNLNPHPYAYFEGLAKQINKAHFNYLITGFTSDEKPAAYIHVIVFNKSAIYLTGCSDNSLLKTGINYLTLWTAILHAKKLGCTHFEIGTTDHSHADAKVRNLATFKSKFGGDEYQGALFTKKINSNKDSFFLKLLRSLGFKS